MILSESKIIKSIFITIFLSLFLGTGSAFYWVSAAFISTFFLSFSKHLEWKKFSIKRLDFIAWSTLLISFLASAFLTKSIPASFEEIAFYITAFIFYWLISLFPNKLFSIKDYADVVLISTTALSIISFINYFFILPSFLSKVSLTDYYYGHNHIAAILILALPIAWYYALFNFNKIYKLLVLFLSISLIFSFGRVAIIIGVFQFIYLFLNYGKKVSKKIKYIFTFVAFIILIFIFSLFGSFNKTFPSYCHSSLRFKTVFCKNIEFEPRLFYWSQAIDGLKENLFFGSGLGTFYITNEKYRKDPIFKTFYAHNDYLQHFSEAGIVGGFSFILFIFLLIFMIKKINKKDNLSKIMLIGLIGILIDIFFDFDFSIRPVFILTMSYFAIMIRHSGEFRSEKHLNKIFKNLFILLCVLTLVISGLYFYNILLLRNKNTDFGKILPIFNSQKKLYFKKYSFDSLHYYFKNDAEFYKHYYNFEKDDEKKVFMSERIADLSPSSIIDFFDFELYESQDKWEEFGANAIDSYNSIILSEKTTGNYHFFSKEKIVTNLVKVANYEFERGNYALAGKYYKIILKMQKWVLHFDNSIALTIDEKDFPGVGDFFNEAELDPQYLGKNHDFAQSLLLKTAADFVKNNPKILISQDIKYIIPIIEWEAPSLWKEISIAYDSKITELINAGSVNEAWELIIIWYEYWQVFNQFDDTYKLDSRYEKILAEDLVEVLGDDMDSQTMQKFEEIISNLNDEYFKYENQELTIFYQLLADRYFESGNRNGGINALKKMQQVSNGSNYWVEAQLGNYYLSIGEKVLARREFKKCLEANNNDHTDCEFGMLSIDENWDRSYKYSQTREIILGNKTWDDFQ